MQQRLPRILGLLAGTFFTFIGLTFLFSPQFIFSGSITLIVWFRYLSGGLLLFWGLINFGWDWLPVTKVWQLSSSLIDILGCGVLAYICLVDGKFWSLIFFLSLLLVSILAAVLAGRISPKMQFLRLSTVLLLVPPFIYLWQLVLNRPMDSWLFFILILISLIFTSFLILATLLLIFSNNSRSFINFQFIFAIPWILLVFLLIVLPSEPVATFLAGSIAMVTVLGKQFELLKVNETWMTPTSLGIFLAMQGVIACLSVGFGILLHGSSVAALDSLYPQMFLVILAFILTILPTVFFIRIMSGFQNQFESIFLESPHPLGKVSKRRLMLSGGIVSALTLGYSSLAQRRDSLSKIRKSLSAENFTKQSTAFLRDTTNLVGLSEQLETTLEIPVAAQILVASLQQAIDCNLCCIFTHSPEEHRLIPIAISGSDMTVLPARFRLKMTDALINKAVSARKSILINPGTSAVIKNLTIEKNVYTSLIVVPLLSGGFLDGAILLADKRDHFLTSNHLEVSESAGSQLLTAWSRYDLYRSVVELMTSSTSLTSTTDMQTLLNQIAEVSSRILKTRFSAIIISIQEKVQIGYSGNAPDLLGSLKKYYNSFLMELTQSSESFAIHDVRKDPRTRRFRVDVPELSSSALLPGGGQ